MTISCISDENLANELHSFCSDKYFIPVAKHSFSHEIDAKVKEGNLSGLEVSLSTLDNAVPSERGTMCCSLDSDSFIRDDILALMNYAVMTSSPNSDCPDDTFKFIYITSLEIKANTSLQMILNELVLKLKQLYPGIRGVSIKVVPKVIDLVANMRVHIPHSAYLDNRFVIRRTTYSENGCVRTSALLFMKL